jgi:VanZ family protein
MQNLFLRIFFLRIFFLRIFFLRIFFLRSEQWCARQPHWVLWLLTGMWYSFITYLSHIPTSTSASTKDIVGGNDSLNAAFRFCAHLGVFGVLGVLVYVSVQRNFIFTRFSFALALGIIALAGGMDEVHQSFVPGRFARLQDVFTDITGAIIMLVLLIELKKRVIP